MRDLGQVVREVIWDGQTSRDWESQPAHFKDRWRSAAKAAIRELLDTADDYAFEGGVVPEVLASLRRMADVPPEPTAPAETPSAEPAPAESADARQLLLEHARLTIQFLRSMATVTLPACMQVAMADRAHCLEAAVEAFEKGTTT